MNSFSFFYNIILIIIGCGLSAFGTSCFLLPNQLSSGGFSGIATIFYYLSNIQMGTTIMLLNIPVFIWGYFKLGWKFIIKTTFATLLYSNFIDIFEKYSLGITDKFLACIYGGILIGIGLAITFKANTSTGGTDLIAHLAQNYNTNLKMSNIIMIIDIIIVISNLIVFKQFEIGLYSGIAIYIIGKMIDIIFEGINFCKIIYIISEKEEINNIINKELKKGATNFYGKGSFTKKEKTIVMCVVKRRDVEKIKNIIKKVDSQAFIIISDAREVLGIGFK